MRDSGGPLQRHFDSHTKLPVITSLRRESERFACSCQPRPGLLCQRQESASLEAYASKDRIFELIEDFDVQADGYPCAVF